MARLLLLATLLLLGVHLAFCGKDMEIKYITATGNIMIPSKQYCSTAAWYKNADSKKTAVRKGGYTILITEEGTKAVKMNTTSSKVECKDLSDDGSAKFDEYMSKARMFELGIFDFVEPAIGKQKAILFTKPISPAMKDSAAIMWINNETKAWSGLDYLTPGYQGYMRFWWDSADMQSAPPADSFNTATCDSALPQDYSVPNGTCPFNGGKAFDFTAKSFVSKGVRWYQDKDNTEKWGKEDVTMAVDKDKKKLAMVGGQGDKQWGMWTAKGGLYAMHPGKKCKFMEDMAFDKVVGGYNSPFMAWAGKGKVPSYGYETKYADTTFDIYEGLLQKDRPYPAVFLVNSDGIIEVMSVVKGKGNHIHFDRTFFDDIKVGTPNEDLFTVPERCLFPDAGQGTSAAQGLTGTLTLLALSLLVLLWI